MKVPVLPLLQCTDTEIFYPVQKEPETYENEYVFIGNSRGVARRCIVWASQDKLPLKIWGRRLGHLFWETTEVLYKTLP